jgi:hypothetical protein
MLIVESAGAAKVGQGDKGEEEEENPLDEDGRPKRPKIYLGHRDTTNEGLDLRFGKRKFWIGIGFAESYGYAQGNGLEAVNKSNDPNFNALKSVFSPGLAWAGWVSFIPEFGYQLSPNLAVSIAGRIQYIYQPAKYTNYAANGALSGLLKLIYYTQQSQLRFFGAGMVGGGEGARFVVYPAASDPTLPYHDFQDTVRAGPFLAGVGGGLNYEASKAMSLVVEVDALAGLPQFGIVADAILALQINIY